MKRLASTLVLTWVCCGSFSALASDMAVVPPGTVVRWEGVGTTACAAFGRSWAPVGDTCYYAFDLLQEEGVVAVERTRAGRTELAGVHVGPYPYPVERLQVATAMVHPPPEAMARIEAESQRVAALWSRTGPPRFTLPLLPPLAPMPAGGNFGTRRVLNGEPRSPHSGIDYAASTGTPVQAVAAGVVALAENHYFGGNSVFVDHGGGLVSISLHLDRIDVVEGQEVERGQRLGTVGATGRVTGAHLHFGVRWHGARVDPSLLFGGPGSMPGLD
jgi:murein DD-endopeptidase MepM/ murein hydrolase activator NlpD